MSHPHKLLLLVLCTVFTACQTNPNLRVLAYNIRHGEGVDHKLDLERIAAVIRAAEPDLVALQEVDRGTSRTDHVDQAKVLGELTGMHHVFGAFMPYRDGEYGMAILSRYPIAGSENIRLPRGAEPRTTLTARVRLENGEEITLAGIHFYATGAERLAQAEATITALESLTHPVILAGDFNSKPGGPVMNRLSEAFANVPKTGSPLTFPSPNPQREIDHFMLRPLDRFAHATAKVLDEPVASDHRPLLLEIRLR